MTITVLPGDCLDVLRTLADNSIDSCVTDPPYALVSAITYAARQPLGSHRPAQMTALNRRGRSAAPCASRQWLHGQTLGYTASAAFSSMLVRRFWRARCCRVLKPGAHVLAFGGTRTYHRLACAIEDAGFEIRDSV